MRGSVAELVGVLDVRREGVLAGVAVGRHRQVDEQPVVGTVEVAEQPPVSVTGLHVSFQADGGARGDQFVQVLGGLFAEAHDRAVPVDALGRVDADEADLLVDPVERQHHRVAVDDPLHRRVGLDRVASGARSPGAAAARGQRGDGGGDGNQERPEQSH